MKDIAIFGVGGFGREVLALIKDINKVTPTYNFIGFFDDGYEKGYFDAVITTNLTYMNDDVKSRDYLFIADMGKFLATIIDFLNHDASMSIVNMPTDKIHEIVEKYNKGLIAPELYE